nr:MAG TPA: hypothetical protein [Bacteriophage sp.]
MIVEYITQLYVIITHFFGKQLHSFFLCVNKKNQYE